MSDPVTEEESLISQEDIDKLMDLTPAEESMDDSPDDDLGELSQDDIDSLLNSNVQGGGDDGDTGIETGDDDDLELISPSDIDKLMNSGTEVEEKEALDDSEDVSELLQEDVDSLVNVDSDNDSLEEDNLEMISQDDINRLMGSREKAGNDNSEDSLSPQENSIDERQPGLVPDISGNDDGWTIEESDAVKADDCEVSQETLDRLTTDFDPSPDIEPVILDDEPNPDGSEAGEPESVEGVLEEHIDIVEDDPGDADDDFDDEDVTQEDIDALLMSEEEEDEELMISQDDIDTLLMAADEDDEDFLGDLMDNDDGDEDLEDEFGDEDFFNFDDEDDFENTDDLDPIILSSDDKAGNLEKVQNDSDTDIKSGWYKSKLVIACVTALVFLGIAVPIGYFVLSGSDGPVELGEADRMVAVAVNDVQEFQEPEIEIVDVVVQQAVSISGNILLKDFIVLAPAQVKTLNYVSLDISIDYIDEQASREILANKAFYRGLIYDSIRDKLALALDQMEVTQADIQTVVEDTLKRVIPGDAINRVSLISFKTS